MQTTELEIRRKMLLKDRKKLSLIKRTRLLGINRSSLYYRKKPISDSENQLMQDIYKIHIKYPYLGSRRLHRMLKDLNYSTGRHRIRRLMRLMRISALHPKRKTSIQNKAHKKYPYLLKGLRIEDSNHVWCADITYIPMSKGFVYLVAIMDWYSKYILSWMISTILDSAFCIEAFEDALDQYGSPEIFNTDQGCQFTSNDLF